jgi:hypothetical protein
MTIQIKKEVTEEIEIGELPTYRKTICHFYKVISLEECVCITRGLGVSIQIMDFLPSGIFEKQTSTEHEFNEAYEIAKWEIDSKALGLELDTHQLSPGLSIAI